MANLAKLDATCVKFIEELRRLQSDTMEMKPTSATLHLFQIQKLSSYHLLGYIQVYFIIFIYLLNVFFQSQFRSPF